MRTIVIAWIETAYVPAGTTQVDLGYTPKLKEIPVAKAVVWLNEGTQEDVRKAASHASLHIHSDAKVYTFDTTEEDPLGKAKTKVLTQYDR